MELYFSLVAALLSLILYGVLGTVALRRVLLTLLGRPATRKSYAERLSELTPA